jgi:hypothetical protein
VSEPEPTVDQFTQMMRDNGFEVTELGDELVEETIEYTGLAITYHTDEGYPVTIRAEFPEGHGMDAARALVLSGNANGIKTVLAGGAAIGDASIHGYLDANGIDAATYIEDTAADLGEEAPPLSDADGFFTL